MTVRTKGSARPLKSMVADLVKTRVLVGIPSAKAARAPEDGKPAPINNATIGYLMETGEPERNLPARPFLAPGIAAAQPKIVAYLKTAATAAVEGDAGKMDGAFHAAGLAAQDAIKAKILEGDFAPLSERTLQARARRRTGKGKLSKAATSKQARAELASRAAGNLPSADARPLYDTHSLFNSITYVVTKGKPKT